MFSFQCLMIIKTNDKIPSYIVIYCIWSLKCRALHAQPKYSSCTSKILCNYVPHYLNSNCVLMSVLVFLKENVGLTMYAEIFTLKDIFEEKKTQRGRFP